MTETTQAKAPVQVDTTLLGIDRDPLGNAGIDAAATFAMTPVDQPSFAQILQQGGFRRDGFSSAMQGGEASGLRGKILEYAKQFIGTPYVWGGESPGGFDCSGLLQYTLSKFGINIPRVSQQQSQTGRRTELANLQPGDFVVFGSDAHHIAFYLGNGQILEAPRTGLNVRIRSLGRNENAWGVHYAYPGE